MQEIIDIFRMKELSENIRINIIISLGVAINNRYGMNLTEVLVYELVKILNPEHKLVQDEHYLKFVNKYNLKEIA